MKTIEEAIDYLVFLSDDLAAVGDRIDADSLAEIVALMEEQKQLGIPMKIEKEKECLRCPKCGTTIALLMGRG